MEIFSQAGGFPSCLYNFVIFLFFILKIFLIFIFFIKNLDLQLEANWIRPFTYSHFDTVANYTHYNQPLAHPLMFGVRESIGILRYQPAPRWAIQAKAIVWKKGMDPAGRNYGKNIFMDSDTRSAEEGI